MTESKSNGILLVTYTAWLLVAVVASFGGMSIPEAALFSAAAVVAAAVGVVLWGRLL